LNHDAPSLFDVIARTAHERIDEFGPQALSNTAWSFATLKYEAPSLFDAIEMAAKERVDDFKPQELSNTAWAFATLNQKAPLLFDAIETAAKGRIDDFTPRDLSSVAWSFAVLNHDSAKSLSLTDPDSPFAQTLLSIVSLTFSVPSLVQLHQYHLWCREKNGEKPSWFSNELKSRCMDTFVSTDEISSQLQNDVLTCLAKLQEVSQVQEEVLTNIGYRLDAVIVYRGSRIGVEVDGPSHFVGRTQCPNGSTVLKHRQLRNLEGWTLVSIPYWEWDEVSSGGSTTTTRASNKQAYLRNLLDGAVMGL
jgi:RAP domain